MHIEEKDGRLAVVDFNEFGAYKIASKIESDGMRFYQDLQNKAKRDIIKSMAAMLADEEKRHLRFFESSLSRLQQEGEDEFEEDDILRSIDYGIFTSGQQTQDVESLLNDPSKTVRFAIGVESKTIQFYESCKECITDIRVKEELDNIIEEEKKHKRMLEELLKKL
ncbi:ferritin family protein [Candidatus Omnitrophota bacterium]